MKNKKNLSKYLWVLTSVALLQSCAKRENNSVDQLSNLETGTISGRLTARLVDTLGAASVQFVGTGKVVNAWVDTRDYLINPDFSGAYARKYYSTTTDSMGRYSFTIDVSPHRPANVNIVPSDFEADVLKKYSSGPDAGKLYTERQILTPISIGSQSISKGQNVIVDINFTKR